MSALHLSPAALDGATRLIDGAGRGPDRGDIVESERDDYALATFARRKKSAGIGLRNFHTNVIGRSALCDT